MPTTLTEPAIVALKTKLEAIGDGSATWSGTHRPLVTRQRPNTEALPWSELIYLKHAEQTEWHCSRGNSALYLATVMVTADWFFDSMTWNADTDTQTCTHDIYLALRDHTCGGTVDLLEVIGVEPITPNEEEDPRCKVRATIRLQYRFDKNDPNTRA